MCSFGLPLCSFPCTAHLSGSTRPPSTLLQDTRRVCIPLPQALSSTSSCSVLFLSVPESGVQGPHGEVSQWYTVYAWVPQVLHCSSTGAGKHPFPSVFTKYACSLTNAVFVQLQRNMVKTHPTAHLLTSKMQSH